MTTTTKPQPSYVLGTTPSHGHFGPCHFEPATSSRPPFRPCLIEGCPIVREGLWSDEKVW